MARFRKVAPYLYMGGEPRGETSFSFLAAQGVKTIISVDARTPESRFG